ncbi:MAG: RNA polymerase sigma factor [Myxococcales bacterium]|nr:RNA polymerase sigma factor [Myxococcales bacterium]
MTEVEVEVDVAVEEDAALVRLAAGRGLKGQLAFEKLVDRHQHWLVRLLIHLLGSQSDAEDVAQEAFIRAFLAIEDCGDGSRFRGWLRVIARRLAFNHRRDARTRAQYEERSGVLAPRSVAPISGQVEGRDLLKQVLGELAYPYREIMVLRFVEELPIKEIARVLEIGESAAKMRLSRARAEFQRTYEKKGGSRGDTGRA